MNAQISSLGKYPLASMMIGFSLLLGCATMAHGTRQDVFITTEPAPALVTVRAGDSVNTVEVGEKVYHSKPDSPLILSLERGSSYKLEVSKEGYKTQVINIGREVPVTWWVLDAFTLGVGNIVDAANGALFDLKPDRVFVILEPMQAEPANVTK